MRHFVCGLAQAVGLYPVLGISSLQWLAPYFCFTWMHEDDFTRAEAALGALLALLAVYPLSLCLSVALKWLLIGRYKAGSYPLWGQYYFRWWLVNAVQSVVPIDYLAGTPLLNVYYRLLGAKIGRNVYLGTDACSASSTCSRSATIRRSASTPAWPAIPSRAACCIWDRSSSASAASWARARCCANTR